MDFDSLTDDGAQGPTPQAAASPPMFDDLKDDSPSSQFDDLKDDGDKYSTIGQGALSIAEGAAQGIAGPLAPLAEMGLSKLGVPGLSAEDIAGRQKAHPYLHSISEGAGFIGGMFTGASEAGLIGRAAEGIAPEAITALGKIGSSIIKGSIESGLMQASDEVSKGILGMGDPEAPVSGALANIGAAGLFGGALGGAFHGTSGALKAVGDAKVGTAMKDFLAGIGDASNPGKFFPEGASVSKAYGWGQDLYNKGIAQLVNQTASRTAGVAASHVGGIAGYATAYDLTHKIVAPYVEKLIGKHLTPFAEKYTTPLVMRALSTGETTGLYGALDHAADIAGGLQKMNKAVGGVFTTGAQKAVDFDASERNEDKVRNFMEKGGINSEIQEQQSQDQAIPAPQAFAKGGEVKPVMQDTDSVATHFPEQSMLMGAAKSRISNYLNSLKPQKNMGSALPYDHAPDQKAQEKKYSRAIQIAASPLHILNKVKDGSLTPDELGHFHQLYPEMYNQLSRKMTEKITEQQVKGERPNYHTRQGLSMFLGSPLDSSFTPASIMAAQNVFAQKKQGSQPTEPSPTKKGTSKLGDIPKQFQTPSQASEARQVDSK